MQQRAVLLTLALLATQFASASSLSAVSEARLFLRAHAAQPPQADELTELKNENPEAYGLVKALLMKRSLGLLNPRHPTASFAKPSADEQQPAEQGPEAFQQFASPADAPADAPVAAAAQPKAAAVPYAEVQGASAHKDWLNWKPQESAMNDEQMVQSVLGAVAELKGKKAGLLSKSRSTEESSSSLAEAEPVQVAPVAEKPTAPPAAPVVAAVAPAAPQENSYLKTVDLGLTSQQTEVTQEKPKPAPAKRENSYLKGLGLDLSGDMPQHTGDAATPKRTSQVQSSSNLLTSFSWGDDSNQEEQHPQQQPQQQPRLQSLQAVVPKDAQGGSLLSWLGVVNKAPQPKATEAAPAKASNPYLMDLS
jgi:hypothetical protein